MNNQTIITPKDKIKLSIITIFTFVLIVIGNSYKFIGFVSVRVKTLFVPSIVYIILLPVNVASAMDIVKTKGSRLLILLILT